MKCELKKKAAEQEKNRNSQKSVKSVRLMAVGVYGGKDFFRKRYVLAWNERVPWEWERTREWLGENGTE